MRKQAKTTSLDIARLFRKTSRWSASTLQDTTRAGELLVETLMKLVRNEPATGTTLPASLIVRRSSGERVDVGSVPA